MIEYKFKKKGNYLVACNYSMESMALVDMLLKQGVKPIVVAVDYSPNGEFDSDFEELKAYCAKNGLRYEIADAPKAPEGVDFVSWARGIRYDFFKKIYDEVKGSALFLSHSQDDLLETYLYQKKHEVGKAKYGISPTAVENGMMIVRPLLHFSAQDLLDYCEENNVPYSRKTSVFEKNYTKSSYYREVAALSEIDRENLLSEMIAANDEDIKMAHEFRQRIAEGEELDIRALISLSKDEFADTMVRFINQATDEVIVTPELLAKIRAFCLSQIPNDSLQLTGDTYLMKQYDIILIGHRFDELPYTYLLGKPTVLDTPNFYLDFSMGAEDRGIHEDDYPLTIRTALPYDTYVVHDYLESVHTLYSLWKMPMRLRYVWPIFLNKNGRIIYVPRYRQNFSEEHTSVLRMKLKDDER